MGKCLRLSYIGVVLFCGQIFCTQRMKHCVSERNGYKNSPPMCFGG